MKLYRLLALLLLLLASWSASAAEIVPLLSQSVLATASVRLNLRQTLAALVTEKLPEYSRPQLAAIQYRYEQQLQEKARLGRIDTDQAMVQRVRRIVRCLAGQAGIFRAGAERWAWEVHVVNDPMPGAFSKPGGKIDITTGMINGRHLTDDEIAAVLAHEMGHVLSNRPLSHIPAIKRNQEIEADITGLELMALAGFNPQAAIDALTGSSTGRLVAQVMDSHPTKLARAQLLNRILPQAMAVYHHTAIPAGPVPG